MIWDKEMLSVTLSEASADGSAVRTPDSPDPGSVRALRNALYNRAKADGKHKELEFSISGTHVIVKRKQTQTAKRP